MIKLTAVTDKEAIEALGAPASAELCYVAKNGDTAIGAAYFCSYTADLGDVIYPVGAWLSESGDTALLDGLLRAGLFYAQDRGTVRYEFPEEIAVLCGCNLRTMGFTVGEICSSDELFAAECHGCKGQPCSETK